MNSVDRARGKCYNIVRFRTVQRRTKMQNVFEHYLLGEHLYAQTLQPVCARHELSYAELSVLLFLANNPSFDTASDISKCRNLAKSHVSTSVRNLEERGMLTREYKNGNRRSVHLCLTPSADQAVADGREAQARFAEILFDGIGEDEKDTLTKIFEKIDENIKKAKVREEK